MPSLHRSILLTLASVSLALGAVSRTPAQLGCTTTPTTLQTLGSPNGCDRCGGFLLPGSLQATSPVDYYIHSDLPEIFRSNGVLYTTAPVLPADSNGNPPLLTRTQNTAPGFTTVDGSFDVFIFHINGAPQGQSRQPRRITVYVENTGTGPIEIDAQQAIITDGIIGTVHQMESNLGRAVLEENWDRPFPDTITIPPGEGRVVAYSLKQFGSTSNTATSTTNINCFGNVRAFVTNPDEANHPTSMVVSVVAIGGGAIADIENATRAVLNVGAESGETAIDLTTFPSGCQIRRAVGIFPNRIWTSDPMVLDLGRTQPAEVGFQMALFDLQSTGCPAAKQSIDMVRWPGFARGDSIGNFMVEHVLDFQVLNSSTTSTSEYDIEFGKSDADVGLGWQVVVSPNPITPEQLRAAPVRTGWAGPQQANLRRSFLEFDGGTLSLGPCEARYVAIRYLILGNSSLPFQVTARKLVEASTELIVDNEDLVGFSRTGTWITSSNLPLVGANSIYAVGGGATETATWATTLPESGTYEVYASWTASFNRTTAAPYTVQHQGGNTTVTRNQRENNNQWILLGVFPFTNSTPARVVLTDSGVASGDLVVADAVRFVKVGGTSSVDESLIIY